MGFPGHDPDSPVRSNEGGVEMRHASLFTGIGGFDLAATWMGWETVFAVEVDQEAQKTFANRYPEVKIYEDITQFDATPYRGTVDVISGGFPCQPFSLAGKRKGSEDDRFLWKEMLRVIAEVQPRYVLAENVIGLLSIERGMVFRSIIADLESQGYHVGTLVLPAASVGAPHRRNRVWIPAYRNSAGL